MVTILSSCSRDRQQAKVLDRALALHVQTVEGEPVPDQIWDDEGLREAQRSAYGIFPSGMNGPERRFAEWLGRTEGVRRWLRNPSAPGNGWAVRLILASGRGFNPDFVVGVDVRRTANNIRLVEVKDDGEDGRLHSDRNREKIRARHRDYHDVLFVSEGEGDGSFQRLEFSDADNRTVSRGQLFIGDLRQGVPSTSCAGRLGKALCLKGWQRGVQGVPKQTDADSDFR